MVIHSNELLNKKENMSKTFVMISRFNVSSCQFFLVSRGWILNEINYLIDDTG